MNLNKIIDKKTISRGIVIFALFLFFKTVALEMLTLMFEETLLLRTISSALGLASLYMFYWFFDIEVYNELDE